MSTADENGPEVVDLFTPGEHAIVSEYLGVPPPDLDLPLPRLAAALKPFRLPEVYDFTPCAVATATIRLERIQARLPNWSRMGPGGIVYGREERFPAGERHVLLTPAPLFCRNASASWPRS